MSDTNFHKFISGFILSTHCFILRCFSEVFVFSRLNTIDCQRCAPCLCMLVLTTYLHDVPTFVCCDCFYVGITCLLHDWVHAISKRFVSCCACNRPPLACEFNTADMHCRWSPPSIRASRNLRGREELFREEIIVRIVPRVCTPVA